MSKKPHSRQTTIINARTGERSLSKPMPSKTPRQADEISGRVDSPVSTALPGAPVINDEASSLGDNMPLAEQTAAPAAGTPVSAEADERKKAGEAKNKPDIETLEQFIAHAYARKGQHIALKSKIEQSLAGKCDLNEQAKARLMKLAEADIRLAVPRQLLLVSREVQGAGLRGALLAFVRDILLQHKVFAEPRLQDAIRNQPESLPISDALAAVANYQPVETEDQEAAKDEAKTAMLRVLRHNATYLLATWFACHRGASADELAKWLQKALWAPAAIELKDETARLRALTEVEETAVIGWVGQRFLSEAANAEMAQVRAENAAQSLRSRLLEVEAQLEQTRSSLDAHTTELEALRASTESELAQQRKRHADELIHLRHELEQLRGRLVRRLDDSIEMLEVGLTALRNKTPRVEVMLERAEHVVDALRAEKNELKEE